MGNCYSLTENIASELNQFRETVVTLENEILSVRMKVYMVVELRRKTGDVLYFKDNSRKYGDGSMDYIVTFNKSVYNLPNLLKEYRAKKKYGNTKHEDPDS